MDPLSVTSGIVGIVAFAFQMAKTASKVKRAVEEVRSAPKEARKLVERLVMLETACQLIGFHLERRETLPTPASPTKDILSKALGQFLVRARELEQILLDLGACNGLNQTPWPKFGTVSRMRLVLRKDKISFLVQEIDRVISLLQLVIQVDMWTSTFIPAQPPSPSSNRVELLDKSPSPERGSSMSLRISEPSPYVVDRRSRRVQHHKCRTFRYLGCITYTITEGWIGDDGENDADRTAYRKGHITFRLPLTSTEYSIHYDVGIGNPSYALNVAHIIDEHSELGQRLHMLMWPDADTQELQEMISKRELSIYSVYRWEDEDVNLFFMAVAMRWARGCRYLLQHDFRHKFEEDEPPRERFLQCHELPDKACEVTEILLSTRSHDMRRSDVMYLLDTGCESGYLGRYLNVFLTSPAIDYPELLSRAWKAVVHCVFDEFRTNSSWIPALRTLVEHGVNLHQSLSPHFSGGLSAYVDILSIQTHPFEADNKAYSWLEMLKTCGVDISSYLKAETTLIDKFGFCPYTDGRKMKKITLEFDGLPMPSWRWEVPMDSSIIEVLEEFLNFGPDCLYYQVHTPSPEGPDDFKSWKAENYDGCFQFPFRISPLDLVNGDDFMLHGPWCRETYYGAVEIRDKRIARHQAKKWRKAHPGEKPLSKTKMPGTWVD